MFCCRFEILKLNLIYPKKTMWSDQHKTHCVNCTRRPKTVDTPEFFLYKRLTIVRISEIASSLLLVIVWSIAMEVGSAKEVSKICNVSMVALCHSQRTGINADFYLSCFVKQTHCRKPDRKLTIRLEMAPSQSLFVMNVSEMVNNCLFRMLRLHSREFLRSIM